MKILIVRFSSFGDILQTLPCVKSLKHQYPQAQIDWLTREDFTSLIQDHPHIDNVFCLHRSKGTLGLLHILKLLKKNNYTHIYDAHNNLRSGIVRFIARVFWRTKSIVVRPKNRWKRFLFFKLRKPVFKMPFRGALSYTQPLSAWGVDQQILPAPHLFLSSQINLSSYALPAKYTVIAPSAAWANKRWPIEYWKKLITLLPKTQFVVLGGPQDTFCQELQQTDPSRVINLAGKCSLIESCLVVKNSQMTISADTGILHAADQLGVFNIGLIGPTAFGYTSLPQSHILESSLACKPCSKDGRNRCINAVFQKCMKDILPEAVADKYNVLMKENFS